MVQFLFFGPVNILARATVALGNAFENGQAYVALSRVKDMAGLWIEGVIGPDAIKASPEALAFLGLAPQRVAAPVAAAAPQLPPAPAQKRKPTYDLFRSRPNKRPGFAGDSSDDE